MCCVSPIYLSLYIYIYRVQHLESRSMSRSVDESSGGPDGTSERRGSILSPGSGSLVVPTASLREESSGAGGGGSGGGEQGLLEGVAEEEAGGSGSEDDLELDSFISGIGLN
jgi:hypothetical protein